MKIFCKIQFLLIIFCCFLTSSRMLAYVTTKNLRTTTKIDPSMKLFGWITPLLSISKGLKYFDTDKESNRKFRRTIFNKYDWRKHRSGNRYFTELLSIPRSVVLRGLTMQALFVTIFSTIIVVYNVLIEVKILPQFLPIIASPSLPFSLTSSALGLLLVFRTNAAYSRWKDARIAWANISARCFDIMRQSVSWMEDPSMKSSMVRYLCAYVR